MKIARHLREFLEKKGYLELPMIGRFEVQTEEMILPQGEVMTRRKLNFSSWGKNAYDDSLVQFLGEKLKSETCVICADIRSFTHYLNELLLQGLEVEIPGVGFLNRHYTNEVLFSYNSSYQKKHRPVKSMGVFALKYWM